MKKFKQILAWVGIIALGAIYIGAFVLSFFRSEQASFWFRAAIGSTIIVPVFLYLVLMVAKAVAPKKSDVIDAIVFDMGKVLMDFPWDTRYEDYNCSEEAKQYIHEVVDPSPRWAQLDYGTKTVDEFIEDFVREKPEYADEIRDYILSTPECVTKFWYTEQMLKSLRTKGYKLYYLSNWCREHYEYLEQNGTWEFLKYFHGGVWSFRIHERKPTDKIYKKLIGQYKIDPARTVFIDDNLENVEAARKLGFAAIHFTSYNDMVEKLNSIGVYF